MAGSLVGLVARSRLEREDRGLSNARRVNRAPRASTSRPGLRDPPRRPPPSRLPPSRLPPSRLPSARRTRARHSLSPACGAAWPVASRVSASHAVVSRTNRPTASLRLGSSHVVLARGFYPIWDCGAILVILPVGNRLGWVGRSVGCGVPLPSHVRRSHPSLRSDEVGSGRAWPIASVPFGRRIRAHSQGAPSRSGISPRALAEVESGGGRGGSPLGGSGGPVSARSEERGNGTA